MVTTVYIFDISNSQGVAPFAVFEITIRLCGRSASAWDVRQLLAPSALVTALDSAEACCGSLVLPIFLAFSQSVIAEG